MITENFIVANLKCRGCENMVIKSLSKLPGVEKVKVDLANDCVIIEHSGQTNRDEFVKKLHVLGYPQATEENGLLTQLKSYTSCLAGRLTNNK